jgi:DNA-binding XRE family transcriptional regulator
MSDTITIPSDALPFVRMGAHDLIGDAVEAISTVNDAVDREDHPERYQAPFLWLARVRALLDVIGWRTSETAEVTVCLADHGTALCEAVDNMLGISINALREAKASERARAERRVRVLLDFGKDLDGAYILRSRNDPRMRALHKSADELLAEQDRELIAFGRAIRRLRAERNMSEGELAAAAGLTPTRLDAIEAGRFDPRYDEILALARGLGVTPTNPE